MIASAAKPNGKFNKIAEFKLNISENLNKAQKLDPTKININHTASEVLSQSGVTIEFTSVYGTGS